MPETLRQKNRELMLGLIDKIEEETPHANTGALIQQVQLDQVVMSLEHIHDVLKEISDTLDGVCR